MDEVSEAKKKLQKESNSRFEETFFGGKEIEGRERSELMHTEKDASKVKREFASIDEGEGEKASRRKERERGQRKLFQRETQVASSQVCLLEFPFSFASFHNK